jgi:hypothetical protein
VLEGGRTLDSPDAALPLPSIVTDLAR